MSKGIGDADLLQKRIPRSARYRNVPGRVDTGASMSRHLARVDEIQQNYRIQRGELFKRIRLSTFAQLVLQVDQVNSMNESSLVDDDDESALIVPKDPIAAKRGSSFLDVINGTGEISLKNTKVENAAPPKPTVPLEQTPYSQMPYLLVDVRDQEDFMQCHIITAQSYPSTNFSRTMNPFSHEMLQFKNVEGKIIILYDIDELVAVESANTMCQRGFENVFILSGGLRVVAQKLPKGLITGSLPFEAYQAMDSKKRNIRKFNPKDKYPADPLKKRFTNEDLVVLTDELDVLLTTPSDAGSRLSKGRHNTDRRTKSQTTISSSTSRMSKPWK
jgi:centrosomal protein CEP41